MGADIRTVRLCKTEFLEPTDRQLDAYVRARHVTTLRSVKVLWIDTLDEVENHARAAAIVLGRRPEFRASIDGGGYFMGCEPDDGSHEPLQGDSWAGATVVDGDWKGTL